MKTTEELSPAVTAARAQQAVALYTLGATKALLLPTLGATGNYTRTTANFVLRPGQLPQTLASGSSAFRRSSQSYNYFNLGLTLTQTLWDFGVSVGTWRAAEASLKQQAAAADTVLSGAFASTARAYFQAQFSSHVVAVARDTLDNQQAHHRAIAAQVRAGQRPPIDLAQAETDEAQAEFVLINSDGNRAIALAQLAQALGVEGQQVGEPDAWTTMPTLGAETKMLAELEADAFHHRTDLRAAHAAEAVQQGKIQAARGDLWPKIQATAQWTEAGETLDRLGWNWSAGGGFAWSLGVGPLKQLAAQRAALLSLRATRDQTRQTIRSQLLAARIALTAGLGAHAAAQKAVDAAITQRRLAESRYHHGLGSVIELSDAQLQVTTAQSQFAQAKLQIALARIDLLFATGTLVPWSFQRIALAQTNDHPAQPDSPAAPVR